MKRFGNLYQKIYDMENIKLAHKNAKKGKAHYAEVKMVDANPEKYFNKRSEGWFKLQEMFIKGRIKILEDPKLMEQLLNIRFKYKSNGTKAIVSKDEMRKQNFKSPDRADALLGAIMCGSHMTGAITAETVGNMHMDSSDFDDGGGVEF